MSQTYVEKLLGQQTGQIATVRPDLVMISDGVSHHAVDDIAAVYDSSRVVVVFDHDVPTGTPEAAAVFRKINHFAKQYNLPFIQAQGIGYSHLLANRIRPGQLIVTGGSHSAIFGSVGALGINVSIPELARVVETGRYSLVVPETVQVKLTGSLKDGVSMMDAALLFLRQNPTVAKKAIEFSGATLSRQEKAVLCSMACQTGAFTAFMTETVPENAIVLDLSAVEPMAVMPCQRREDQKNAKIAPLSTLAGTVFQAGQIGGYTGGTIEELRLAAEMAKGKKIALGFRLTVCPATSDDYIKAIEEGLLETLIDFGAQIHATGDHSENRQGAGVVGSGEKLLTTGLYTYAGCMGCDDAEVYTASVQSVMQASLCGKI